MELRKTPLAVVWVRANTLPTVRKATFYGPQDIHGDGSRDYHAVAATDVGIILLDGIEDSRYTTDEFLFRLDTWHLQQATSEMLAGYDHEARIGMPVLASKEAKEQWGKIKELLSGRTVVSSNSMFDVSVLRKCLIMHGVCEPLGDKPGEHWEPWNPDVIDASSLAHVVFGSIGLKNMTRQNAERTLSVLKHVWARRDL
jgi:hypothetical protein